MSAAVRAREGRGGPDESYAFGKMPHGLAADHRLRSSDVRVAMALLYWAFTGPACTPSDWRIADYTGLDESTVKRSLRHLEQLGYVRRDGCKPTDDNLTGRVIRLLWVEDPGRIPPPPARRGAKGRTREADGVTGGADCTDPGGRKTHRPPGAKCPDRMGANCGPPGGAKYPHKEDRCRKRVEDPPKTGGDDADLDQRQRPQAAEGAFPRLGAIGVLDPGLPRASPAATDDSSTPSTAALGLSPPALPGEPESPPGPAPAAIDPEALPGLAPPHAAELRATELAFLRSLPPDDLPRFAAMPPAWQTSTLGMARSGSYVQARRRIERAVPPRPPMPVLPDGEPLTTPRLIEELGRSRDPGLVPLAAQSLAVDFGNDQRYWPAYKQVCEDVWYRRRPAESVVYAYGKAMGPKARNRGAIFKTELDRCDREHGAASG